LFATIDLQGDRPEESRLQLPFVDRPSLIWTYPRSSVQTTLPGSVSGPLISNNGSSMRSQQFRVLGFCLCTLVLVRLAAPVSESLGTEPPANPVVASSEPHPLAGHWKIDFHPNQAIREYTITSAGQITFVEFPDWKGTLTGNRGAKSSFLLRFEGEPGECVERLTLVADGRLLVEHYNPGTTFAAEGRPDQIGIGVSLR
jgi:hypothetical protein